MKQKEVAKDRHHRPIYFRYYSKGSDKGTVVFEIEGEGESIQSKFARNHESRFFEFLKKEKTTKSIVEVKSLTMKYSLIIKLKESNIKERIKNS